MTVFLAMGFSFNASATVTLNNVIGASNAVKSSTDGSWTVYGGIQGANYSLVSGYCNGSNATCNTCIGADATVNGSVADGACNPQGVFGDTLMTFQATTTASEVSGGKWWLCGGTNPVGAVNNSTGKSVYRQITWGEICGSTAAGSSDSSNTSCASPFSSTTLYLGYGTDCNNLGNEKVSLAIMARPITLSGSSNYTDCPSGNGSGGYGACHFSLFPGDAKVYLESSSFFVDASFPAVNGGPSGITFDTVMFFFLEVPEGANDGDVYQTISNDLREGGMNSSFIPVADNDTLAGSIINKLNNDQRYCFRMASQDKAKNIELFTPTGICAAGTSRTPSCNEVCMTPSEVVGLLSDKKCFIATAAFGSEMDAHVQRLREFRNKFMAPFWIGRKLVKGYYSISPKIAHWIAQHEEARTVTRWMLWPILGWAELALKFGWAVVVAPFALLALMAVTLKRRRLRKI